VESELVMWVACPVLVLLCNEVIMGNSRGDIPMWLCGWVGIPQLVIPQPITSMCRNSCRCSCKVYVILSDFN
jgi:hypothetical protein